jgi:hypothetical protein
MFLVALARIMAHLMVNRFGRGLGRAMASVGSQGSHGWTQLATTDHSCPQLATTEQSSPQLDTTAHSWPQPIKAATARHNRAELDIAGHN